MLGNIGMPGMLIILVIVLVLFGRGRIAGIMGEMGKGLNAFKSGMKEGQEKIEDEKADAAQDITPPKKKTEV